MIMSKPKKIKIQYFAILREERGVDLDELETSARTPEEVYETLKDQHGFSMSFKNLRVAINDEFESGDHELKDGDTVVFIPPVAGG